MCSVVYCAGELEMLLRVKGFLESEIPYNGIIVYFCKEIWGGGVLDGRF